MSRKLRKSNLVFPHNIDAEKAVLGAVFLNNDVLVDLVDRLRPWDFYRFSHMAIFRAMIALDESGVQADFLTVADYLKRKGLLEKIGGIDYLVSLGEMVATSAGSEYHASIIRDAAVRRSLMEECQATYEQCMRGEVGIDEILDKAEQSLFELAGNRVNRGPEPVASILKGSYSQLELSQAGEMTGLSTGFDDFDRLTGRLQCKDLIVLAARPSMGKTALAVNIALHVSAGGHGVAFFSLEMAKEQLGLRLMSCEAMVDVFKMRAGRLGNDDFKALVASANRISDHPIFIDDTPDISILELKAKVRRLNRQHRIHFVIVDYLQLMRGPGFTESRQQEVADICRGLKGLAKSFDVPVLALSQLNRRVEDRPNKRPELADLRESGSIEQDSDLIAFIYRAEVYRPSLDNHGLAEIIIAKQRNGPIGSVKLTFLDRYASFKNYASHKSNEN